ncbi:hypothetical protein PoB_007455600 [Plakobranchus ocellatus]|uniref:Uncharacterized protein n=1 Tax=Plakobranchus ocellatus TaxID=259542 RepID=A0AAV4DVC6_9GAST|nr:hypothetical protein PoB_007455600 [Plakobranchus ocellatus]
MVPSPLHCLSEDHYLEFLVVPSPLHCLSVAHYLEILVMPSHCIDKKESTSQGSPAGMITQWHLFHKACRGRVPVDSPQSSVCQVLLFFVCFIAFLNQRADAHSLALSGFFLHTGV